ncbi:MAG TPA: TonB family protein [Dokdonella sp.]
MNAAFAEWLPWIQALGWTLLHFIWQGLVICAAFAAARALIPRTHCTARYAAGLVGLAALTCWPIATFLAMRPWSLGGADAAISFVESSASAATIADVAGTQFSSLIDATMPWLVLLWAGGVLAMGGRIVWQWRALMRLTQSWAESSVELDAALLSLKKRFAILQRVRVLVSERVDTPMLVGWLRPVVLLPAAVVLGFPRQQIELIVAHELCHLRRYDHLVNFAQVLVETLFFYHPVVHWISREVRNERELCCDKLVLGSEVGAPRDYAHALAALEDLRQASGALALAANGGELLERVRRIVGMPASRLTMDAQGPGRWLLLVGVLGITLLTALRIERAGDEFAMGARLPVDWLQPPPALTLAAATLAFSPPRLRPAAVAPPPAKEQPVATVPRVLPAAPLAAAALSAAAGNNDVRDRRIEGAAVAASAAPASVTARTNESPSPAAASPLLANNPIEPSASAPKPVSVPAPVEPARPIAIRTVTPTFPGTSRQTVYINASFSIAADGSVRDVQVVGADADTSFGRVAARALRQWRFDPATLASDHSIRYTQSFVFAPREGINRDTCVTPTGTHICRDIAEGMEAKTYTRE